MSRLLTTIALLLSLARPAAAEYWVGDAGELLHHAVRVEIIRVDKVAQDGLEGVVTESIRGTAVGGAVKVSYYGNFAVKRGDEVLVVCDRWVCPRALGVDRGGYFILSAFQPMDGAMVSPGLVERGSLRALAAGKKAAPICIDVKVGFIDEPAARTSFRASFDPTDGDGTATGAALGAGPLQATLLAPHGLFPETPDTINVKVRGKIDESFVADGLRRQKSGCYAIDAMPAYPLARSRAELKRNLAGSLSTLILARGQIAVRKTAHTAKKSYPLTIEIDASGQLAFRSPLFQATSAGLYERYPPSARIGFAKSSRKTYPMVMFDIGPTLRAGLGVAGNIARLGAAAGRTRAFTLPVTLNDPAHGLANVAIGVAKLVYLPASP